MLLDSLPGAPRLAQEGSLEMEASQSAYLLAIVPAVTVLGHGAYLRLRILGAA